MGFNNYIYRYSEIQAYCYEVWGRKRGTCTANHFSMKFFNMWCLVWEKAEEWTFANTSCLPLKKTFLIIGPPVSLSRGTWFFPALLRRALKNRAFKCALRNQQQRALGGRSAIMIINQICWPVIPTRPHITRLGWFKCMLILLNKQVHLVCTPTEFILFLNVYTAHVRTIPKAHYFGCIHEITA